MEFLNNGELVVLEETIRAILDDNNREDFIKRFDEQIEAIDKEDVDRTLHKFLGLGVDFDTNPDFLKFYNGVLKDKMQTAKLGKYPLGHPLRVYLEENIFIKDIIKKLQSMKTMNLPEFSKLFNTLATVEKHFARKENQLFPYLEKYGWTSPSQNMWAFHDRIRNEIKVLRSDIEQTYLPNVHRNSRILFESLEHIMEVEEQRLLPNAFSMLSEDDWKEMREGDAEIGWMIATPPPYPEVPDYIHPSQDTKKRKLPFGIEDKTHFDEGYLTMEQVNSIFRILPVDITFVDENDRVVFYNRGEDRVFPRSAGIIGREVKFCHPPKSVDQVLMILEEFKKGTQDTADFWISFKGRFIHIQYFAVRDGERNYKGVIEMSQDVTEVRALEGEKRLLDWD